ncbi:hypothetical protein DRQ25_09745 [Candidatus Fermentibacteria bacterium]|nr:MAG: hypothetical protein DRQ25_09745 [Candidatus Fermentibacteria bacterium]
MDKYPMKAILTTLMFIMLLTGCAEKERYAERYLDSISLVLHMDRPAEVAGVLRQGASPSHAVEYPDLSGISRLSFICSMEDSAELFEQISQALIPCELSAVENANSSSIEYWQEGIAWQPEYHWTFSDNSCVFTATVIVSNSTCREWFSQRTVMKDFSGNPICMVDDTLIIRNGDMELGWWNATGPVLPVTLSYGWPVNSQWNQLVPCIVPHAGDLITGIDEWPIRTGDTLWVQPETEIEITETVHQNTTGYDCTLQIYNQTGVYTEIRITHPDRTPRGALFQPQENFPSLLGLQPGDVVILEYRIHYN